jgi:hypothetical protein
VACSNNGVTASSIESNSNEMAGEGLTRHRQRGIFIDAAADISIVTLSSGKQLQHRRRAATSAMAAKMKMKNGINQRRRQWRQ